MRRILITVCILSLFFSCSNDDSNTPEAQIENFYALTVGNSWEYRWYRFQTEMGLDAMAITESISIVDTEDINGDLYYKFKKVVDGNDPFYDGVGFGFPVNGEYVEYYRDSLGYLVNEHGDVKFVNNINEEFVIYEPQFNYEYAAYAELSEGSFEFTTEAGTFNCLEMKIRYEDEDENTDLLAVNKHYYADDIGLIKYDVVFMTSADGNGYQKRLESYNVQ